MFSVEGRATAHRWFQHLCFVFTEQQMEFVCGMFGKTTWIDSTDHFMHLSQITCYFNLHEMFLARRAACQCLPNVHYINHIFLQIIIHAIYYILQGDLFSICCLCLSVR